MARPRAIDVSELTLTTCFKVQICTWGNWCLDMKGGMLVLHAARTTDTIDDENFETQGLFFALLRHSAGGRQPGNIVAGDGKHLNLSQLARYMRKRIVELLPPLTSLMKAGRIKLLVHSSEKAK